MKKRMFKSLMFMAVVCTVVMFGTVGVSMGEPPTVCSDGTFTIEPALFDVDGEPQSFPLPGVCEGEQGWVWEYIVTVNDSKTKLSDLTKMHIYIPSLPPNTIEILGEYFDRGVGSTVKGYGTGIYNGVVLSVNPVAGNLDEKRISFCTDLNTTGTISLAFETAKALTGCASDETGDDGQGPLGGIIGPGFGPPSYIQLETDKKIGLGNYGHIWAKKHPVTGCIKYFYYYNEATDPEHENPIKVIPQAGQPSWITGEALDIGDFESPMCREAIMLRKGSPLAYWGFANGMFYCLGVYDVDNNPVWCSPCSAHPDY